ncbi:hypothetical protein, partial [Sphingobacterium daejeonense]|uniref:hypothetical protein n=1 Tax=Sphingobacterium daejeonense TaxID=371142 RepID=UPI003D322C65
MKRGYIGRSKSIVLTPNHLMDVVSSRDSTYQLNIFLLLIEKLKDFAQKEFDTYLAGQKALYEQEVLILKIPLSSISNPSEYRDVKKAFLKMTEIQCKILFKEANEEVEWKGNLFNVEIRSKANYSSNIKIKMDIVVARLFIKFNRNNYKQA